jgi:hypothetical protein
MYQAHEVSKDWCEQREPMEGFEKTTHITIQSPVLQFIHPSALSA